MSVRTRIGLAQLLMRGMGSVELPEEITLHCPNCGTECSDKGQCLLELAKIPAENKKGLFEVKLIVDCRVCECSGESPTANYFSD